MVKALCFNKLTALASLIHWTFYFATSFLEKCRKVVLEKWFFKLGFFSSGQPLFSYQISRTRFHKPLFSNRFSTLFQRYTYRVLQTIQMKLILLWVWAERAVLGRAKTALKLKHKFK